jgi:hypothetical protein
MKRSESEKAAASVVKALGRLDVHPTLVAGEFMSQPYDIQKRLIETFVYYLERYKAEQDNPLLRFRTHPDLAQQIERVDLTDFDV